MNEHRTTLWGAACGISILTCVRKAAGSYIININDEWPSLNYWSWFFKHIFTFFMLYKWASFCTIDLFLESACKLMFENKPYCECMRWTYYLEENLMNHFQSEGFFLRVKIVFICLEIYARIGRFASSGKTSFYMSFLPRSVCEPSFNDNHHSARLHWDGGHGRAYSQVSLWKTVMICQLCPCLQRRSTEMLFWEHCWNPYMQHSRYGNV